MTLRVAIVDDDESVCRSFGRFLRASGIESVGYFSAESFIADPAHTLFDCIVLDIQLGGMSGLDLQRQLLEEGLQVPILFVTAQEDPTLRLEAEERGCAGFFHKSQPGAEIIEAIADAACRKYH